MNPGRTVFAQLLQHLPRYEFNKCVHRYDGNYRIRRFPCYDQLLCLAFAQLTYRESLRDIETYLNSHHEKLYHVGFRGPVYALNPGGCQRTAGLPDLSGLRI